MLYPSTAFSASFWVICRSAESSRDREYNGAAPGCHHLWTNSTVPKSLQWRCCLSQLFDFRSNRLNSSDGLIFGGPFLSRRYVFAMCFFCFWGGSGSCDCQCEASDKLRSSALLPKTRPVAPQKGATFFWFSVPICPCCILGIQKLKSVGPNALKLVMFEIPSTGFKQNDVSMHLFMSTEKHWFIVIVWSIVFKGTVKLSRNYAWSADPPRDSRVAKWYFFPPWDDPNGQLLMDSNCVNHTSW